MPRSRSEDALPWLLKHELRPDLLILLEAAGGSTFLHSSLVSSGCSFKMCGTHVYHGPMGKMCVRWGGGRHACGEVDGARRRDRATGLSASVTTGKQPSCSHVTMSLLASPAPDRGHAPASAAATTGPVDLQAPWPPDPLATPLLFPSLPSLLKTGGERLRAEAGPRRRARVAAG